MLWGFLTLGVSILSANMDTWTSQVCKGVACWALWLKGSRPFFCMFWGPGIPKLPGECLLPEALAVASGCVGLDIQIVTRSSPCLISVFSSLSFATSVTKHPEVYIIKYKEYVIVLLKIIFYLLQDGCRFHSKPGRATSWKWRRSETFGPHAGSAVLAV